ncbi:TPA_asm: hypothetical protein [Porphyromonas phage phage016a_WW2866]|uniref:Uncharacterized protein n=1 Tax=Porphyromonas phage phage016a_WW2866 TaxID=3154106 RepID=A0AAT9JBX7_9CAUD
MFNPVPIVTRDFFYIKACCFKKKQYICSVRIVHWWE